MRATHRALAACTAALASVLAASLGGAPAAAHVIPLAPLTGVSIGPVLVGDSTVWGHSIFQTTDMVLQFATPAGRTTQVLKMHSNTCDRIDDVVGSPTAYVVTVVRIARDANANCQVFERRTEILVGRPGSTTLTPLPTPPDGSCVPRVADVDGVHLVLLRDTCPGRELVVLDLRTGATLAELAFDPKRTFRGSKLAIGGRHLALTSVPGDQFTDGRYSFDISPQVRFFDWQEQRELAVVSTARPGRETTNGDDKLAIDEAGVAVLSTANISSALAGPLMDWMSPAAPVARALPVSGHTGGRLNMQRGAVALVRPDLREVIVGVDGRTRLDLGPLASNDGFLGPISFKDQDGYGIDLDDGRIALERNGAIVNDTIPPALPAATFERPSARAGLRVVSGRLAPSVIAAQRVEVAIVQLAEGLRPGTVRAGAAATLGTSRRCRQASARGRLSTLRPRDGRCVPTRFLRAKGTTSWRLSLPRRLPRGRYAVYARAVDIAGRVGRVAAKDARIVRVR